MKLLGMVNEVSTPYVYRINFLTNFLREPVLRRMEAKHGLIRPEWTVLGCLFYRDGVSARDICEITEQPRNTISRGVIALEAKGLIRREVDVQDARRSSLSLTEAGRTMYEHLLGEFRVVESRLLAQLDEHERASLDAILGKLCMSVNAWFERDPTELDD